MIDWPTNLVPQVKVEWMKEIPIKFLSFIWRASLGRIPAATELAKRGITVESIQCGYCMAMDESPNHILLNCTFAKTVWEWCNMPQIQLNTVGEPIEYAAKHDTCRKNMKVIINICYSTLWEIWKARNERIFKRLITTPTLVADNIQMTVHTWMKYKSSCPFTNLSPIVTEYDTRIM
uniref:Reverse transcriptase zinc-binding domain-containing protein n=1 Tax=Lactuca sativa TaxID=4236 RepID=A0A9R1VRN1_LACSA|nr:hypothetical protein LSAT_V11C400159080 [Lactuca sativa]